MVDVADELENETSERERRSRARPPAGRGGARRAAGTMAKEALRALTDAVLQSDEPSKILDALTFWNEDALSQRSKRFVIGELATIERRMRASKNVRDVETWTSIKAQHDDDGADVGRRYAAALGMNLLNGALVGSLEDFIVANPTDGRQLMGVIEQSFRKVDVDSSMLQKFSIDDLIDLASEPENERNDQRERENRLGLSVRNPEWSPITDREQYLTLYTVGQGIRGGAALVMALGNPRLNVAAYFEVLRDEGFRV